MNRDIIFTIAAFCMLLPLVSACKKTQNDQKSEQQIVSLRMGVMSSMDYLPFALANELQFYTSQEGKTQLQLELVTFFSPLDRDAAFQAGQVDAVVTDYTGAILQCLGGVDAALVTRLDGVFTLISNRKDGESYQEQTFGVSNNTVVDYLTDVMVQARYPEVTSIPRLEVPKIPIRTEMLAMGQVEAAILPDPFATIAILNPDCEAVVNTQDLGVEVTGLLVSRAMIDEAPEALRLLLQGYAQALEQIDGMSRATINQLLIKYAGAKEAIVDQIQLPQYRQPALPQRDQLQHAIELLYKKGVVSTQELPDDLLYDPNQK